MKRKITEVNDVVYITERMPIPDEETQQGLTAIYVYAKEFKVKSTLCLIMAFLYGYSLGVHDSRKKA